MAWSAPMTAIAGAIFTAAQFNQYVRDNLNSTAPALATAASQLFVSTGPNAIAVRVPTTAEVDVSQTTTSQTYANLTTSGPAVTVDTGTIAIVLFGASMANNNANAASMMSVEVTGASTVAANDKWSVVVDGTSANNLFRACGFHVFTGLAQGSNTFRAKYRVGSATTGTFHHRELAVIPL